MSIKYPKPNWIRSIIILGIIWLVGVLCDRLWFALDHSTPAWDQADYLNGAMNYWQALQTPQWLNGEWWQDLWLLSSKVPPLTYISTVPFLNFFGTSSDAATIVFLFYSALLLISVYGLGATLFSIPVGLWAVGLCQLLPGLYYYRLEFLLDYPLTAIVIFSFWWLTIWKLKSLSPSSVLNNLLSWLYAAIFGLSLGLALMVKQTALLFLFIPLLWLLISSLYQRRCQRFVQLLSSLFLSSLVCGSWYRTNWLLILTAGKRATIDSAIAEGDPPLHSLDAWIYYLKVLPYLLSWHLLLIPIVGLLIYWWRKGKSNSLITSHNRETKTWITVFLLGGYFLCSLNINKDARYILPLLPVLSLLLAVGLLSWTGKWKSYIRFGTVGLALLLMLFNLFPLGGEIFTHILSPHVQHQVYQGEIFPHQQVIEEIVATSPYLQSTLGVLPSTEEINQHNLNYYGARSNFQVYGRQVGVRESQVEQDKRSLDWFLTKTGNQGSVPKAQAEIVKLVEQSPNFNLQNSWLLPDKSTLKLYHRRQPSVEVQSISAPPSRVKLEQVTLPQQVPPGVTVPVTYQWSGSWEELQSGLVLLTWHHEQAQLNKSQGQKNGALININTAQNLTQTDNYRQDSFWIHDHGIGMNRLKSAKLNPDQFKSSFQVIERTAMVPDSGLALGDYTLQATYLNQKTGATYPITTPPVTLTIDPTAPIPAAPELDLVTQLRNSAIGLSQGREALDQVFEQTGRINQYDPIQDYLVQAEQTLAYRLEHSLTKTKNDLSLASLKRQQLNWAYGITLSRVLLRDVKGAIAACQQLIELDDQNPYNYAYLAFIHLYNWNPKAAQKALARAIELNPTLPELHALKGIAALMQGNLFQAWYHLSTLKVDT